MALSILIYARGTDRILQDLDRVIKFSLPFLTILLQIFLFALNMFASYFHQH